MTTAASLLPLHLTPPQRAQSPTSGVPGGRSGQPASLMRRARCLHQSDSNPFARDAFLSRGTGVPSSWCVRGSFCPGSAPGPEAPVSVSENALVLGRRPRFVAPPPGPHNLAVRFPQLILLSPQSRSPVFHLCIFRWDVSCPFSNFYLCWCIDGFPGFVFVFLVPFLQHSAPFLRIHEGPWRSR